jgi:hypothetical protein
VSLQNTRGSGNRPSPAKALPRQSAPSGRPTARTLRRRQEAQQALAAARQVRERRNRRLWTVIAPLAVVVLAATMLVAVKVASGDNAHSGKAVTNADAAVLAQVVGVPASVFDTVGAGQPYKLPQRIDDPISADGKPHILYIGAEYCPFCAVARWPLIVALSRFGTWHGLRYAYSAAAPEVYPNTATFSFHGTSYTSKWLSFTGVETHTNTPQGNSYGPLDPLSRSDSAILSKHDPAGSIPFTDLGGKYAVVGATYNPTLVTGRTHAEIAATLRDPSNKTGAGIVAAANVITAAICDATAGQPSNVCSSAGVAAAAKALR